MKSLTVRSSASICLLLMSCASARAEGSACEVLPASQVTAITGRPARIQESKEAAGHCVYRDSEGTTHLRMYSNDSEAAARTTLQREVARLEREGAVEQLRGIGSEARFVAKENRREGEIVARYDTTVLVIGGALDQAALVALMRSAIAALAGQPHEEHP